MLYLTRKMRENGVNCYTGLLTIAPCAQQKPLCPNKSIYAIMKSPLSNEFKVACEIYTLTSKNEKVWLGKIQENLAGKVSKRTIRKAIDTLHDWRIIKAEYGPTDKGKAGRLYSITKETESLIKELCERYYWPVPLAGAAKELGIAEEKKEG